jgi:hypothetical protein
LVHLVVKLALPLFSTTWMYPKSRPLSVPQRPQLRRVRRTDPSGARFPDRWVPGICPDRSHDPGVGVRHPE